MSSLASTLQRWPLREWPVRLPASLLLSVVAHVFILAVVGLLIRAMPAVVATPQAADTGLTATLTAAVPAADPLLQLTSQELPPPDALPPLEYPVPPEEKTFAESAAEEKPILNTPLAGIAVNPATAVIDESFAPVGHISTTKGNGRDEFGANLSAQMLSRYPDAAARTPTLIGALSMLYPTKAARLGHSQKLSALVMVDASGNITEVRVLPEEPSFAAAIITALKGAKFTPAERDGKSVPYWTVLDFRFNIDGPTDPNGRRLDQ